MSSITGCCRPSPAGGGGSAAAKVADLTAADGPSLGAGLATCLASNTKSDEGVAEWIEK